jgi:DNA-binding transcriptional ArsR family regulator
VVLADADIADVAAAIANPARGRMLNALLGGPAMPAGHLARIARVSPSTPSSHLAVYDHLAEALGVAVTDRLCVVGGARRGAPRRARRDAVPG